MGGFSPKAAVKAVIGPCARAAWPAIEAFSGARARMAAGPVRIVWKESWDGDLDAALDALPALEGCSHEHYRALMGETGVPKRHAIALEGEIPSALISLRRRKMFWEPVASQCLPGVIAPARDRPALARALNALGCEVRMSYGLGPEAYELGARLVYPYQVHEIDLTSDYEAHWREHKQWQLRAVKKARTKCADMAIRADADGDLGWILENWRQMWADDPQQEVLATADRLALWTALRDAPRENWCAHTIVLAHEGAPVAGMVLLARGDTVTFQCSAREEAYEKLGVGTRVMDAAIEWAAANGFARFELGSGEYKHRWAPANGVRHGAVCRPVIMHALYRFDPE